MNAKEWHANGLGSGFQLVIKCGQRQTSPYGQFEIGGVVSGKAVLAGKAQSRSESTKPGFLLRIIVLFAGKAPCNGNQAVVKVSPRCTWLSRLGRWVLAS